MGVFDGFLNMMRLGPDDDDDFYDDYDEEDTGAKNSKIFSRSNDMDAADRMDTKKVQKAANKITPMRSPKKSQGNGMEVCVIKPTAFEDSREITETLLTNRTVVLNVEGLDMEIAQRIIDFASGSCFAIDGNLQKISNYIFIITPASVDISGDFQSIMDSFEMTGIKSDF